MLLKQKTRRLPLIGLQGRLEIANELVNLYHLRREILGSADMRLDVLEHVVHVDVVELMVVRMLKEIIICDRKIRTQLLSDKLPSMGK